MAIRQAEKLHVTHEQIENEAQGIVPPLDEIERAALYGLANGLPILSETEDDIRWRITRAAANMGRTSEERVRQEDPRSFVLHGIKRVFDESRRQQQEGYFTSVGQA